MGIYVKGTNAFFLEWAAISSLPFSIDDPPRSRSGSAMDLNDLIVDLFNGCKTVNLRKGSLEPLQFPLWQQISTSTVTKGTLILLPNNNNNRKIAFNVPKGN